MQFNVLPLNSKPDSTDEISPTNTVYSLKFSELLLQYVLENQDDCHITFQEDGDSGLITIGNQNFNFDISKEDKSHDVYSVDLNEKSMERIGTITNKLNIKFSDDKGDRERFEERVKESKRNKHARPIQCLSPTHQLQSMKRKRKSITPEPIGTAPRAFQPQPLSLNTTKTKHIKSTAIPIGFPTPLKTNPKPLNGKPDLWATKPTPGALFSKSKTRISSEENGMPKEQLGKLDKIKSQFESIYPKYHELHNRLVEMQKESLELSDKYNAISNLQDGLQDMAKNDVIMRIEQLHEEWNEKHPKFEVMHRNLAQLKGQYVS